MSDNQQNKIIKWGIALLIILIAVQGYMLFSLNKELDRIHKEPDNQESLIASNDQGKSSSPDSRDSVKGSDFFNTPRDLQVWDPYAELYVMRERMDRLFGDAFGRFHQNSIFPDEGALPDFSPDLDLQEEEDRYIVKANIPGAEESDFEVTLEESTLTISGKLEESGENRNEGFLRKERRVGRFERSLLLEEPVDASKMETRLANGVLTVIIPKTSN